MRLRGRIDGLARFRGALDEIARGDGIADDLAATAEDIRKRAAANLTGGAQMERSNGGDKPESGKTDARPRVGAQADDRSGSVEALARSLVVRPSGDGGYTVSTALDHGWHREFGSRARPAAPWFAPAAEDARPALLARIRRRLNATTSAALRGR